MGGTARFLRQVAKNPSAGVGGILVLMMVVCAVFAPLIAPYDPIRPDLMNRLLPPSCEHIFGTDDLGRDIFSRVVHGARTSLQVGVVVVAGAAIIGGILGLVAGYTGGWVDELIMRVTDAFLSFPALVLALAIAAALKPSLFNSMIALSTVWWPWYCRLMRAQVLSVREQEYVEAARATGVGTLAILIRHIAPNALAPVIVQASLDFGFVLLAAAGLGFIGLGAQPPTPEWGAMLSIARNYVRDFWWFPAFPGLSIFLGVLGFNLVGDGIRDFMDPRMRSA